MAQSSRPCERSVARPAGSRDTGKLLLYAAILLPLLLGGDILRRVLRVVRPTTAAVVAARRDESAPVHRQTTRVRRQSAPQAVAPRRDRPSDRFLAEVAARTHAADTRPFSEPHPGPPPPDEAAILAGMARSGALLDMAAQQFIDLSHPTEGHNQLSMEQRPSSEALDELRRAGAVIR